VRTPGRLYLVPNLLGVCPPERVLPAHTIEVARGLAHFVAENAKVARAFLKSLRVATPIQSVAISELNEHTPVSGVEALLGPALAGHDLGLVTDAGCPAVADPGARLVSAAHRRGVQVVPLVGPSSLLLALMASGLNGQSFVFHGYLPAKAEARIQALRRLEADALRDRAAHVFIEAPYRNEGLLEAIRTHCGSKLTLVVAADLTLDSEEIAALPIAQWRGRDIGRFNNRPAIFLLGAG
jgi:16S rRNA (cytidine1402-2'-O)-methyltransferase